MDNWISLAVEPPTCWTRTEHEEQQTVDIGHAMWPSMYFSLCFQYIVHTCLHNPGSSFRVVDVVDDPAFSEVVLAKADASNLEKQLA